MASKEFRFHYVKTPTGAISGQSVLTQTEDAINNLGEYMVEATVEATGDATEALNKATEALNTANTARQNSAEALSTVNSALGKVNALTATVNAFDGRIKTAESNAANAVTSATEASNNAAQAVTTSNSTNKTAQQAVTTANKATTTAQNASAAATQAVGTANAANATAADAKRIAQQAVTDTDAIREEINQNMAVITQKVTEATTQAQNAAASADESKASSELSKLRALAETLTAEQQTQAQTNIGGPFLPLSGGTVSGTIAATRFSGPLNGNASTASKWENSRKITLSGNATGAVSLDGSADATLKLTIANGSVTNASLAAGSVTFSKVANADVATQAEAEAGTANNCFMTPLRVAQAINELSTGGIAYGYSSGNNWYIKFTNGFVIQSGYWAPGGAGSSADISLLIAMTTTSYFVGITAANDSYNFVTGRPNGSTAIHLYFNNYNHLNPGSPFRWIVCGY